MAKKDYAGELDVQRLCAAKDRARLIFQPFRERRRDAVKMFAADQWGNGGDDRKTYLNLLSNYVRIVSRHLISKEPRVLLTTHRQDHRAAVNAMQAWCNLEAGRMDIAGTLQRIVLDGLFSMGIAKVALSAPADFGVLHRQLRAGMPYCHRVDIDNWVHDPNVDTIAEACFMGHRFRAPLDVVKEWKEFDKKARSKLTATPLSAYNEQGDEKIGTLQRAEYMGDAEEYEDFVDLWEIYLPRHGIVVTIPDQPSDGSDEPLRVQKWLGPETGMYHFLRYGDVPGNSWPKAPIQDLVNLHEVSNKLWRKLFRQAERQKDLTIALRSRTDDAERIKNAVDGEIIPVDGVEPPMPYSTGGVNPANFQIAMESLGMFNKQGGNLELLGGTGPQTKTATQDKMLNENAGGGISDLQDTTTTFTSKVYGALCWYWWNHPELVMRSELDDYADTVGTITREVHPYGKGIGPDGRPRMARGMPFDELDCRVDPYSLRHRTPEQKAQTLLQMVKEVVMPMMPLAQQQGKSLDMDVLLSIMSEYMDMPELKTVLGIQQPIEPAGAERGQQGPGGEPNGGEYIRRSVGQDGPGAREAAVKNVMSQMAAGQQQGGPAG